MSQWLKNELCELSETSIELLLRQQIPGIVVPNFIPTEACDKAMARITQMAFATYSHLKDIPVHHLGVCHNQWAEQPRSEYFSRVPKAQALAAEIFADSPEQPVEKLIKLLDTVVRGQARCAIEPTHGPYFAGAFRSFRGHGRLHVDHAPSHIKADWSIKNLRHQLTWNVYLSVPPEGGELRIYDTVHTPENEKMKTEGEYYFPYAVLDAGRPHIEVKPRVGDLIIFNTQNFHEIMGNESGRRVSQTSFIGVDRDQNFNFWS